MNAHQTNRRGRPIMRRGAAFLILIVLVLLLVLSSTQMLIRNEMATRRGESGRVSARSLRHAIDVAGPLLSTSLDRVRLPIDEATDQSIEVAVDHSNSMITASWFRGDQLIDQMNQVIRDPSELRQ